MEPAFSSRHARPEFHAVRLAAVLLLVTALTAFTPLVWSDGGRAARVIKVIDGDSVVLRLDGKRRECRLLGIDAPEWGQEPWGRRSRRHLLKLLRDAGMTVRVEQDVKPRDRYDRLLVYLRIGGGMMVNRRMVRDGYAVVLSIPPNHRYAARLRSDQDEARQRRQGFWADGGLAESPAAWRKHHRKRPPKHPH